MRSFIALMLISFSAVAGNWSDLEPTITYELKQSFQLPQIERSKSLIDIMAGERFDLLAVDYLDQIKVAVFTFKYQNCPGESLKTDMEIVPVKETGVEVGAELEKCELEIFIETKDLMTPSFFE